MPAIECQLWRILTKTHIGNIITDKLVLRMGNDSELCLFDRSIIISSYKW